LLRNEIGERHLKGVRGAERGAVKGATGGGP
jgi:hypothetical protein